MKIKFKTYFVLIILHAIFIISCNNRIDSKEISRKTEFHVPHNSIFYRTQSFAKQLGVNHLPDSIGFRLWFPLTNYKPDYLLAVENNNGNWQTVIFEIYDNGVRNKIDSAFLKYWTFSDKNASILMQYLDSIGFFNWELQDYSEIEACTRHFFDGELFIIESYYDRRYTYSIYFCPCMCNEVKYSYELIKILTKINRLYNIPMLQAMMSIQHRCVDCE